MGGGAACLPACTCILEGNFQNRRTDVVIKTIINLSSLLESLSEIILRSRGGGRGL